MPEQQEIDSERYKVSSKDVIQPEFPREEWAIDLPRSLRVLHIGKRTIGASTSFMGGLALLYVLIASPYYTANATFVAQSSSGSSSAALLSQLSSMGASGLLGGGTKASGDLYVGILKSRSISDKMIARFDLMHIYREKKQSLAEKALAKNSKFDVDIRNSIVTIQVTDKNPERARDLANGYLDELMSVNQRLALTESSQRRLFFEQQLAKEKDALADAEVSLKQAQERTGLISPAGQTSLEIQSIAQMKAQIASREVELAGLRQSSTDQNPEVVRILTELSDLRRQLANMQGGDTQGKVGDIAAAAVPELGLEYVRKQRDVKYHEALFEILLKQFESARMDEARDPPLLQILDPAIVPDTKAGPHRALIVGLGIFLGLLFSCAWLLFKEAARTRSLEAK